MQRHRDPARAIGRLIAGLRLAVGVVSMVAPRLAARALFRHDPPASTTTMVRLFATREVALALGSVDAARHDDAALRGWLRGGALVDAGDVLALLADRGRSLRSPVRWTATAGAAGAAVTAYLLADSLGDGRPTGAASTGTRSRPRSAPRRCCAAP